MTEGTGQPVSQPEAVSIKQTMTAARLYSTASENERYVIEALRSGDEKAFVTLIEQYHGAMLRLAMMYVSEQTIAEEAVQEAWMGVLQGLNQFEGRSSLKTWIFRILTNCAKTHAIREGRSVPFSSLAETDVNEPAVDPDRFLSPDSDRPGWWISLPENWDEIPEKRLLSQETYACIESAIATLSPNRRAVITLRDREGWTAEEVCSVLGISEANQRVLLHRARSSVRRALEQYLGEQEES